MSVSTSINLPVDEDGFLRRECPHCQREFKWFPSPQSTNSAQEPVTNAEPNLVFCPLCGQSADANSWWTQEQVEYAQEIAKAQFVGPMIRDFQNNLLKANTPDSSVRISVTPLEMSVPEPLQPESNDMRKVESPCHPLEPVKVPEDWVEAVHCIVCGATIQQNQT